MEPRQSDEREFHDRVFRDGTRAEVTGYYAAVAGSRRRYEAYLREHAAGREVLEYGCGPGSSAFFVAELGGKVTGIDLSPVAIELARSEAASRGISGAEFRVMDAERLGFPDGSFDLVCGTGILHHLDLERAFGEIARVLRAGGSAIFIEPLGHNPLIKRFRRATPHLRTAGERPLLMGDVRLAEGYFGRVEMHPYGVATLAAIPFRELAGFGRLVSVLERVDGALFRAVPRAGKYAWQAVLIFSGRPRGGG